MSGHSKWSKVKHQKATTDVIKAAAFTKASRAISVAVKAGGGLTDPEKNFRLRLAIDKAREVNMPKENIDRILAGAGDNNQENLTEATYEAYAAGNVAILIAVLTDNTNRTLSHVKSTVEHFGGVLVAQGAVSHLFTYSGLIRIPVGSASFEDIFLKSADAGALDVIDEVKEAVVVTRSDKLASTETALKTAGFTVTDASLEYVPEITQPVSAPDDEKLLDTLIAALEEIDDVQKVYTNAEVA